MAPEGISFPEREEVSPGKDEKIRILYDDHDRIDYRASCKCRMALFI